MSPRTLRQYLHQLATLVDAAIRTPLPLARVHSCLLLPGARRSEAYRRSEKERKRKHQWIDSEQQLERLRQWKKRATSQREMQNSVLS